MNQEINDENFMNQVVGWIFLIRISIEVFVIVKKGRYVIQELIDSSDCGKKKIPLLSRYIINYFNCIVQKGFKTGPCLC